MQNFSTCFIQPQLQFQLRWAMTSIGKYIIYLLLDTDSNRSANCVLYSSCRFVNLSPDIADNFKCSICLDIFEAPLELQCGHIYCMECIRSCFNNGSSTSECPECRESVRSQDIKPPNRKLLCLLHNLNIRCEFADSGCDDIVKVENLIAHTRECRFNRSSSQSAPPLEDLILAGDLDILNSILGDSRDCFERRHHVQAILNAYARLIEQSEDEHHPGFEGDSTDDEILIYDETLGARLWSWIGGHFWNVIVMILFVFFTAASIAAIVISALKLHSCDQMPTIPLALMALGISMFLSCILETIRSSCYKDNLCVGLKIIEFSAFGSLIYLSVVVYSNLDYAIKPSNSTLDCDGLAFEFSFWLVSATFTLAVVFAIIGILYLVVDNLKTIWSEWQRSYVLLSFIYSIPISGLVMSIGTVTMGSIYSDSCPAIPGLTTKLIVFGSLGLVCWLITLLSSDCRNCCLWLLVLSVLASFICVAVAVHQNFPWEFTSHALHYAIDCNATIYTYSFVVVCINYVIIGATICMLLVYGGVCTCLFFR